VVLEGSVQFLVNHPRVLEAYLGMERTDEDAEIADAYAAKPAAEASGGPTAP
jgi:hypothetical protein